MITVLMAAKTSTEYMPHAIGSLLAQTYTDWNLIVGVNGIADDPSLIRESHQRHGEIMPNAVYQNAVHITRSFSNHAAIINMPKCPNKGTALNYMVSMARTSHVAILDVDDLWHPLKLEQQIPFLDYGYAVVGTLAEYFGEVHGDIGAKGGQKTLADLQRGNCIINSSVVMKRELAKWEPMDAPIEDYELWLRLASEKRKFFNVNQRLTFIRQHKTNWSKSARCDAELAAIRLRYA